MPRKKSEPEEPDTGQAPGEVLPAMEDTVRKLSSIFTENMRIPEGPAVIENEEDEVNHSITFPEGPDDEDEDDE